MGFSLLNNQGRGKPLLLISREMKTTKIQAAKYYAFLAVASSLFTIVVLSIAKLGAILLNTTL